MSVPGELALRRQRVETLLGFVSFFALICVVWAVWNVLQPNPQIMPALITLVIGLLWWLIFRQWRSLGRQLADSGGNSY